MIKKLTVILLVVSVAVIIAHALTACGSGGSSPDDPAGTNTKPTASAGTTQDVNASSLVTLDGSGSSDADGNTLTYAWTQTSGATMTLSDAAAVQPTFTAGSVPDTYVFQLIANDGTEASDPATVTIRVWIDVDKRIFVNASAAASLAKSDGSETSPYTTIGSAITAATTNDEDVYVAAGTYSEYLTMVEGVSLFGGYEATGWTRDITASTTTISRGVVAGAGLTIATLLNGFTIGESPETNGRTIFLNGGVLTISSNTINGAPAAPDAGPVTVDCVGGGDGAVISGNIITVGTTTSSVAGIRIVSCTNVNITGNTLSGSSVPSFSAPAGVKIIALENSSSATIQQNTIDAGENSSTGTTVGIHIESSASATISRNRIDGGNSVGGSRGILHVSSGSMEIENNIIYAGDGYSDIDPVFDSFAIAAEGSGNTDIVNNTIYLGGNTTSDKYKIGISRGHTGTINVINNLIIQDGDVTPSTQVCIKSGGGDAAFNSVLNNDCDAESGGVRYLDSTTPHTTISLMETALVSNGTAAANVDGNVAWDAGLRSGSDYLLSSSSGLIGAGYAGALVTLPAVDYDGNARPTSTGYDIGADQY